ncbi:alpha-glucan family phosphorylase [Agrobacterium sp. FDAARGOS_525]|uniref:alpha-glucan family phosphorylase n=1 Tax=Agrobacterium sp. FDAARGOS_525 TaxID=2420311 RepID=UPI00256F4716|nr:alpha-glucan family phosphorylase [Agrobacterium sp. FDAARGOS_525]
MEKTEGYSSLRELALDLRWSWNHSSDLLWQEIDAETWAATRNPIAVLHTVSREKLAGLLQDGGFMGRLDRLLEEERQAESAPSWYDRVDDDAKPKAIAYFSMEFMLTEALPIYSGGLGNVAGDQLKAASDLGVPVVGIGLLYGQGYFRQAISPDGDQEALYPTNEPDQLPIRPVRAADGELLRLQIDLPGMSIWIRAWEVRVGRARLYLLDTNDPANPVTLRSVTSQLYGGGPETRLKQEMILGLCGWQLLKALGIEPAVCHLNEGHAAFAAIERARCFQVERKVSFAQAVAVTRAGNVFTTHTAVKAGFDRFAPELIRKYFRLYTEKHLGIEMEEFLALGRQDARNPLEPFNMAYLAVRASGAVNGVSALHGTVSRKLFQPLFPRWPQNEVPIGHVTNGIHVPTWDSVSSDKLWTEHCGKDRWRGNLDNLGDKISNAGASHLWQMRYESRKALCAQVRKQYLVQKVEDGDIGISPQAARDVFDPGALTLGFARRFATYKRPALLLRDPNRLISILTNRDRPVQLVLAGKAHPRDLDGQGLIRLWHGFARNPELRTRLIFLRDYNMRQAEWLVQGVDVWINTPRRPWEASGTSGMKILANGGLNLSELDGWWQEAFRPEVGWAIGDGQEHGDDPAVDDAEAEELYRLLEDEIIPEFYDRDADGVPERWIERVRESMGSLAPQFSTNRSVRQYVQEFYIPSAQAYDARAKALGEPATDVALWQERWRDHGSSVHFGTVHAERRGDTHSFSIEVYLGELSPADLAIEIYADGIGGEAPFLGKADQEDNGSNPDGYHRYTCTVPAGRPTTDYTPRLVPYHPLARIPLDLAAIVWRG